MALSGIIATCISAFVAVFFILSLLAIIMKIILALFPDREKDEEPAYIAAITSTVHSYYPGTKITKIEEIK